ncbi:MAG: hypothetical protein ACI910_000352 [Oleispira sp.]|jgi:hypothetical protein
MLLYSLFACSVVLGGLVTTISLRRADYADTSGNNSAKYAPEDSA